MAIDHPLSPGGDNINKHNMVIFNKTWKVSWNTVHKKQNGFDQIENEKHKSLARARA